MVLAFPRRFSTIPQINLTKKVKVGGKKKGGVSAICQSSRNRLTNELAISGRSPAATCKDLKNTAASQRSFVYKGFPT